MSKLENIIHVDFTQEKREGPAIKIKPSEPKSCSHSNIWVDQDSRKVICEDCKEELDPIRVLHNIAQDEMFLYQCQTDVEALYAEIIKLKKEEKKLKNKIKNAKSRLKDDR